MNFRETTLPGVLVLEPNVYRDERGFFLETFSTRDLEGTGIPQSFPQDNHSRSTRDVIRGLHYQLAQPQGKLVHAARGSIYDVAVDIRVGSPHFGKWFGVELNDETLCSLWIPPGFAHGFCVLSESADVIYKCSSLYVAEDDHGVAWNDPQIGIDWPAANPLISAKDRTYLPLCAERSDLPRCQK